MKRRKATVLSIIFLAILLAGCTTKQPNNNQIYSEESSIIASETESVEVFQDSEEEIKSEETVPTFNAISSSELPGGEKALAEFLDDFCWYGENYDCNDSQNRYDLVLLFLSFDGIVYEFDKYSDFVSEPQNVDYYHCYDEASVDWLLSNIYNFSDKDITELKTQLSKIQTDKDENGKFNPIYYKDGEYFVSPSGSGGGYEIEFRDIKTDGQFYQITYDVIFISDWDEDPPVPAGTEYALMEYKTIEGKGYWSVYKVSDTNFFDQE